MFATLIISIFLSISFPVTNGNVLTSAVKTKRSLRAKRNLRLRKSRRKTVQRNRIRKSPLKVKAKVSNKTRGKKSFAKKTGMKSRKRRILKRKSKRSDLNKGLKKVVSRKTVRTPKFNRSVAHGKKLSKNSRLRKYRKRNTAYLSKNRKSQRQNHNKVATGKNQVSGKRLHVRHLKISQSKSVSGIRLMAKRSHKEQKIVLKKNDKRKIKVSRSKRLSKYPSMPVYHLHTGELVKIRLYDSRGVLRKKALKEFNHVARCFRTGKTMSLNYRLLVEVYEAWIHFGMPQVSIFSGCRQPPHASRTSRHVLGDALDFTFDGVNRKTLARYFLKRRDVKKSYKLGIGYYPNGYHIHVDIRKNPGFWVQLGHIDGESRYAENPAGYFYRRTSFSKKQNNKTAKK
ncbi:MAG: DUF882 domain-containing protein [Deltaproteobacteria bacterium]|nr:DUF882 domain-containing protein [Deltaproteobacteria bacterium]